jgi:hypothetical protein
MRDLLAEAAVSHWKSSIDKNRGGLLATPSPLKSPADQITGKRAPPGAMKFPHPVE